MTPDAEADVDGGRFVPGFSRDAIEVGMLARDATVLAEFYGGVLGLPLHYSQVTDDLRVWYFWCGHSRLKMSEHSKPPEHPHPGGGPSDAIGITWITIPVRNVEEVVERCVAARRTVRVEQTALSPSTSFAVVEDPEGNWVEV